MDKKRAVRALGWAIAIFAGALGVVLIMIQLPWLAIVGGFVGGWYCAYRSLDKGVGKMFEEEQDDG